MDLLEYLFKQHENILGWYKHSETKSTFLHAINALIVGIVNGLVFVGIDKIKLVQPVYSRWLWLLLVLVAVCVIGSYAFMLRAVWARHHGHEELRDDEKLWFFGHIGSMEREKYRGLLDPFEPLRIETTMLAQNQILAKNVTTKFDALNWAITLTTAALILVFGVGLLYASTVLGAE